MSFDLGDFLDCWIFPMYYAILSHKNKSSLYSPSMTIRNLEINSKMRKVYWGKGDSYDASVHGIK